MFKQLQQAIQQRYNMLAKDQVYTFYKAVDREKAWEAYLFAFPQDNQQENNCNSCRSFIRQFSGIIFIVNGVAESIWEIDTSKIDQQYIAPIVSLCNYIQALPITDVFLTDTLKLGSESTRDGVRDIIWNHFALAYQGGKTKIDDIASQQGKYRDAKQTLKRALDELTLDSINTMLELTAQGSLYRGNEFKGLVEEFLKVKLAYDAVPFNAKDNFAWLKSVTNSEALNKIRNSSIGTLLVELSEGMELDASVRRFESMVSAGKYKRPTAVVTPKMVADAKKKIEELGFLDSLDRRMATATDIKIKDLLFVDNTSMITDVFADLSKGALVNPKTLSKIEEVSIDDFIEKILPKAKGVELLLEQSHLSNLVTLVTAVHAGAPLMFKWSNPFTWSYTGGMADSMKERVKTAGGNIGGVLRFSIQWNDEDTQGTPDFDAHAQEPAGGQHIYYGNCRGTSRSSMTGNLDVDMQGRAGEPKVRVENITWTDINKMKDGAYKFRIHNYNGLSNRGFKAQIEFNGEIHDFFYARTLQGTLDVADVTLKNGVFTIEPKLDSKCNVTTKSQWGVKTNTFTKVKSIMLSPNYWGDVGIGNLHFIFVLDGCVADEDPRPFYNEHLKQELNDNRKVFEHLGAALKVKRGDDELSGIGFSDTQRNSIIARVNGVFQRTLKINI